MFAHDETMKRGKGIEGVKSISIRSRFFFYLVRYRVGETLVRYVRLSDEKTNERMKVRTYIQRNNKKRTQLIVRQDRRSRTFYGRAIARLHARSFVYVMLFSKIDEN